MSFYPDPDTERQILLITEATPGEIVKSPIEDLSLALPGQPDSLTLYYDALVRSHAEVNDLLLDFTIGADLSSAAVTPGTWVGGPAKIESRREELPFVRYSVPCLGLAQSKPDAIRWIGATETQGKNGIQAQVISPSVEKDTILFGSAPNFALVSTASTPSPAPALPPDAWALIVDPTYHFPDGWFLADIRSQQIFGLATAWLVTYVWRYQFAVTP